jgi:hypothetical protein
MIFFDGRLSGPGPFGESTCWLGKRSIQHLNPKLPDMAGSFKLALVFTFRNNGKINTTENITMK